MKHKMLKVIILSSIVCSSLFASTSIIENNSSKTVLIPVDSSQGKVILQTEKEYRKYLDKKISNAEFEKMLFYATKQNCRDIYLLKKAVVKIIKELNNIKKVNKRQSKLIQKIQKKIYEIQNKEIKNNNLSQEKIKQIRNMGKEVSKIRFNNEMIIKTVSQTKKSASLLNKAINKIKTKNICVKKQIIIGFDKNKIKKSYIKFKKPKEFIVIGKNVNLYDYPVLRFSKKIGEVKFGDKILGDMYTKAGWVHFNDKGKNIFGWVRGFLVYPKVLYSVKNPNPKDSSFIRKNIVECINKRKDK